MEHDEQLDRSIRSWKSENPDWRTHANHPDSPQHPDHIQERRAQICQQLAGLGITGIHRILIEKYHLKPDPRRGHLAAWVESEAITQMREARGIHLPFHQHMEGVLARTIEVIDSHSGHLATGAIAHVEDWFDANILQPIQRALERHRQNKSAW